MAERIIFLDIDGPMIPSGMFFINREASWEHQFSPICVAVLKFLQEKFGAKIVTNSTHNYSDDPNLKESLEKHGLILHEKWRTLYPHVKTIGMQTQRQVAINYWIQEHTDLQTEWLTFDDAKFMIDERLIWVDPHVGIATEHYNSAAELWGLEPFIVLM